MIRKILILAMTTFSLAVCGCTQDLPPTPKTDIQTVQPENNPPETPPSVIERSNPPEPPRTSNFSEQTPANQSQKINVKVYFPDDAGINLVAVNRTIEIKNDAEKYLAAIKLLMTHPGEKDLTVIFPSNAKINGVTYKDGTAFVDFGGNITKSFVGGSTGEELLVGSVVKTLTEFPEVQQVRFLVDGREIETLSGHMDLSEPIKKTDL